jgi:hypothetical protein
MLGRLAVQQVILAAKPVVDARGRWLLCCWTKLTLVPGDAVTTIARNRDAPPEIVVLSADGVGHQLSARQQVDSTSVALARSVMQADCDGLTTGSDGADSRHSYQHPVTLHPISTAEHQPTPTIVQLANYQSAQPSQPT